MYSALFREANAWSASRARMAMGSNRPEAAACVWNFDEPFRARSSHLDSGTRGRHASFDYMRCHASYPACSRPSKTDSQYANPNSA